MDLSFMPKRLLVKKKKKAKPTLLKTSVAGTAKSRDRTKTQKDEQEMFFL